MEIKEHTNISIRDKLKFICNFCKKMGLKHTKNPKTFLFFTNNLYNCRQFWAPLFLQEASRSIHAYHINSHTIREVPLQLSCVDRYITLPLFLTKLVGISSLKWSLNHLSVLKTIAVIIILTEKCCNRVIIIVIMQLKLNL